MLVHFKSLTLGDINDFITGFGIKVLAPVLDDDLAFDLGVIGLRLKHLMVDGVVTLIGF